MDNSSRLIEISDEVAKALQEDTGVEVVQKWFIQPKMKRAYASRKTSTVGSQKKTTLASAPTGNNRPIKITDKESAIYRMRVKGNSYTNSKRNVTLDLVDKLRKSSPIKGLTLGHFRDMLTTALTKAGHSINRNTTIDLSYWCNKNCIIDIPFSRKASNRK